MEPAASIIVCLGGLTPTAKAAATTVTTVQRWRLPKKKGGTGGFIPRKHHDRLLKAAKKLGVELRPGAFLDVSELPSADSMIKT